MNDTTFALQSFVRVLARSLLDKGVLTEREVLDLLDAWFGDVVALGSALQEDGADSDVDGVLQMIHSLTVEFTPR